jgi:Ca2+/H+ antiporter
MYSVEPNGSTGSVTDIYTLCRLTIILLTIILSYITKEIALHVGNTLGSLLNITFRYISPLFISPNII